MFNPDFQEFIKLLNDNHVRYLVVGGYAVAFHGYPRNTGDIDIWVDISPENASKVMATLSQFGFGTLDIKEQDFLEPDTIIQLGFPPRRIDLLTGLSGVSFDTCYPLRSSTKIDGHLINFIDLDNLKINKRASGRAQDIADLEHLP